MHYIIKGNRNKLKDEVKKEKFVLFSFNKIKTTKIRQPKYNKNREKNRKNSRNNNKFR